MFLQRCRRRFGLQHRLRVGAVVLKSIQHWPGRRRTGRFLPLQKRTLLKTPRKCRSHRERGSLLGLGRRLEADTRSLLDSLAWRFCRMRELAIAAISGTKLNEGFDCFAQWLTPNERRLNRPLAKSHSDSKDPEHPGLKSASAPWSFAWDCVTHVCWSPCSPKGAKSKCSWAAKKT